MNILTIILVSDKGEELTINVPVNKKFSDLIDAYLIPVKGTINKNDKKLITKQELIKIHKQIDNAKSLSDLI